MKELIVQDDRELRRIEAAIAAIELGSTGVGLRTHCLLAALKVERAEILRLSGRSLRPAARTAHVAGTYAA